MKDPLAILNAAWPHYDLSDPALKPWHLKATYQLYDYTGKPAEPGTWEYWWASPKVHRSSLQRGGVSSTMWVTPDGTYRKESSGELRYFEKILEEIVLQSVPDSRSIDPEKIKLSIKRTGKGSTSLTCVRALDPKRQATPDSFCFDPGTMAMLSAFTHPYLTQYGQFVMTQGHYFARRIAVLIGERRMLSISVESIDGIAESEPALNRADDAAPAQLIVRPTLDQPHNLTMPQVVKSVPASYPESELLTHTHGVVLLGATVGTDRKIHSLEVLTASSEPFAQAASDATKQYEFKPSLLNGIPVETAITLEVDFVGGR